MPWVQDLGRHFEGFISALIGGADGSGSDSVNMIPNWNEANLPQSMPEAQPDSAAAAASGKPQFVELASVAASLPPAGVHCFQHLQL